MNKKDLIRVTGLWVQSDKNQNAYFKFTIDKKRYIILKNTYADEKRNDPTHILYVIDKEEGK